jgi:hypothetical protein
LNLKAVFLGGMGVFVGIAEERSDEAIHLFRDLFRTFVAVIQNKTDMTVVLINNKSHVGHDLPKEIKKHPHRTNMSDDEAKDSEQQEKIFEEDFRQALTPEQFMLEMERRIMKW